MAEINAPTVDPEAELMKFSSHSTILLSAFVLLLGYTLATKKTSHGTPPGPKGWPIVGNLFSLNIHSERLMYKLNQIYGPICRLRIVNKDFILLGSYEAIREAYNKKSESFSDRFQDSVPTFSGNKGIIFMNFNSNLKEQRRFGLAALREFGMGRRSIEPSILQRISHLCKRIQGESLKAEPFQVDLMIYECVSSVISQLVFNRNLPEENAEFKSLLHKIIRVDEYCIYSGMIVFFPILKHIPPFKYVYQSSSEFERDMFRFIKQQVEEHKQSRDPSQPRDLIDCFLNEMDFISSSKVTNSKGQSTGVPIDASFTEEQLYSLVYDLFLAGSETSSTTFSWLLLYVLRNPDIQKKMQEELDNVLGEGMQPSLSRADLLPYTRAVIQEAFRIRPVVPIGVPHVAARDDTIGKYMIKKGSITLPNIFRVHHDESIWNDSERFDPGRHLDENGKFVKSPYVIPFSLGARQCLGQQLAIMELFLITASLFQRFTFKLVDGEKIDMTGTNIFTLRPYPYKLLATIR